MTDQTDQPQRERIPGGIVTHQDDGMTLEIVQAGGDPPADYLPPIRRIDVTD